MNLYRPLPGLPTRFPMRWLPVFSWLGLAEWQWVRRRFGGVWMRLLYSFVSTDWEHIQGEPPEVGLSLYPILVATEDWR